MKKPFVWKKRGSLGEYTEFHLAWLELGVYISLNLSYADLFFSLPAAPPPPPVCLSPHSVKRVLSLLTFCSI